MLGWMMITIAIVVIPGPGLRVAVASDGRCDGGRLRARRYQRRRRRRRSDPASYDYGRLTFECIWVPSGGLGYCNSDKSVLQLSMEAHASRPPSKLEEYRPAMVGPAGGMGGVGGATVRPTFAPRRTPSLSNGGRSEDGEERGSSGFLFSFCSERYEENIGCKLWKLIL